MAVLNPNTTRHVLGDLAVRCFTYASFNNGDTITIPGVAQIVNVTVTPTTAAAAGATWSDNVVTLVTGGALAGTVAVYSRIG